ncbi:MAG: ester cyclase [Candidatus Schekmanbacteria bacterium]|nr:ester cyclase [Candidatus Schekmanbacteria bacterium]
MSDLASIARQYLEAAPRADYDKVRQLFHPRYSYTGGDGQRQNAEAAIAGCAMFTTAFPDLEAEIEKLHVAGDSVIVEVVATGTHRADMMGIAPTLRRISLRLCKVLEIRDEKIFAEREYFDMAHLMEQLEAAPALVCS